MTDGTTSARDPKVILLGEDIADPVGGIMKATSGSRSSISAAWSRSTARPSWAVWPRPDGLWRPTPRPSSPDRAQSWRQ
jgi:hypothetical protein